MKTEYYVGTVVGAYRSVMDGGSVAEARKELEAVSHRPYSQGFYYGHEAYDPYNDGLYRQSRLYGGIVRECKDGFVTLEQRNNFKVCQELEALSPGKPVRRFKVEEIINEEGQRQQAAHLVRQTLRVPCPFELSPGDILRFDEIIR